MTHEIDHHHQFQRPLSERERIERILESWPKPLYIRQLEEECAREQAEAAKMAAARSTSLRQRFEEWWRGLPTALRHRPYQMSELETALGVPGRFISPVLVELGWCRGKRHWSGPGPYRRYWEPPPNVN